MGEKTLKFDNIMFKEIQFFYLDIFFIITRKEYKSILDKRRIITLVLGKYSF